MSDELYVVLKLISGDTVMGTFGGEDEKFIEINYPIQIKTTIVPGNRESVSAMPFCPFSDSTKFVLEKSHILYIKRLHQTFIAHYKRFLESYEEVTLQPPKKETEAQIEEGFDDLDELTLEEIQDRLSILEAIANAPREDLTEEELDKRVFVAGNDTKH